MTAIDMLDDELTTDLRRTVRAFLTSRCDLAAVAEVYDDPAVASRDLNDGWARELGLAGLLVPEALGGAGATLAEAAVAAHAIGRHAAPLRFLTSGVIATSLAAATGDETLTRALAAGECYAAVAFPATAPELASGLDLPGPATASGTDPAAAAGSDPAGASGTDSAGASGTASAASNAVCPGGSAPAVGDRVPLSGSVAGVMEAHGADVLLVVLGAGASTVVTAVETGESSVRIDPFLSLDETRRLADVTFDAAPARVLATGAAAAEAVAASRLAGQVCLAAELAGTADAAFAMTLDYVRTRVQFGRAIGSYQAIKHRLADLWLAVRQADAAATFAARTAAAWQAGEESFAEAQLTALTALAYAAPVAVEAGEEAVQLHGGNGMTWEYPVHLLLKRAKAGELILGHPALNRRALADILDLPVC